MSDAGDDERRTGASAPDTGDAAGPTAAGDAVTPDPATSDAAVTTEGEEIWVADAVRTHRAPRIGTFVTTGALVGIVVGLVLALVTGPANPTPDDGTAFISFLDAEGTVRLLSALTGGVVGAVAAGVVAVLADRRSAKRSAGQAARTS